MLPSGQRCSKSPKRSRHSLLTLVGWTTACASMVLLPDAALAGFVTTIETVESGTLSGVSPIRISLDGDSNPHIGYWVTGNAIRYARKTGGAWTIETAIQGPGANLQFEVDAAGNAHLFYVSSQVPIYATRVGGAWTLESLYVPQWASYVREPKGLALDSQGNPHVTYWWLDCGTDCDAILLYGRKSGGSWSYNPWLWGCLFYGCEGGVEIDSADSTHFVVSCPPADTWYLGPLGSRWFGDMGACTRIAFAVDRQGDPHFVYLTYSAVLSYRHRLGGVWWAEAVGGGVVDVGESYSLALDANDAPHVAFCDVANGDLRYARRTGGAWSYQVIDGEDAYVGGNTSIAVGGDGRVHIAYFDSTNHALRYALVEIDPTEVAVLGDRGGELRVSPNPSVGAVRAAFPLAREEEVALSVYDVTGRRIREVLSARLPAGPHEVDWDRRDAAGRQVGSGTYFLRLESPGRNETRRIVLLY